MHKTFARDHIVRDRDGRPLGRLVLAGDYKEGMDQIQVALLKIPRAYTATISDGLIYIDGFAYKIPDNLPVVKKTSTGTDTILNSFILNRFAE